MSAQASYPKVKVDDTYGATFIGALITAALYGLTTLQTYFYFVYYPKDAVGTKTLVSIVWVLDTFHTIFVSLSVYHYLVTNYANPPALAIGHWSLFVSVVINITIAFLVHWFFIIRIFRFSRTNRRWWLSSFIALVVVGQFCLGIENAVLFFIKNEMKRLHEIALIATTPFGVLSALSDISIAATLCVLLHTSRAGFQRMNTLVNTLIIYAINQCLLTSVVSTAAVIVFAVSPNTLWFLAIEFVIGKLHANSLLATLNSRNALGAAADPIITTLHLSSLRFQEGIEGEDSTARRSIIISLDESRHREHAASAVDVIHLKNEPRNVLSASV